MPTNTRSFEKFNYLLRPSKQVERKLFIEAMLRLQEHDYPIPDYTYLGLGSVYYADFVLFHKYLYIDRMICSEHGDIPRRMKFNKPFRFIRLRMKPVSDVLPELTPRKKYLVWLDYDTALTAETMRDIDGCMQRIGPGSVFLLTVDAEVRLPEDRVEDRRKTVAQREKQLVGQFRDDFGQHVTRRITRASLTARELPKLYWEAIQGQIEASLTTRQGMGYLQLFNFLYADNAQMMTVGGILDTEERIEALAGSEFVNHRFVRTNDEALRISVPPLTIREKQWLDSNLETKRGGATMRFELDETMLNNYLSYYREYPTYIESLL